MTSLSAPAAHEHIRPLNILRDLPRVADLIEVCFADNLDSEGQSYVQQMRRAGQDASFMQWARHAFESTSLPLSGFVWVEDGRIVGNASLVPFHNHGRRIYLIANVATHPEFRRRGIARALTESSVLFARQRGAHAIWLHARADNPGAIEMYNDLGFEERARRITWRSLPDLPGDTGAGAVSIGKPTARLWPQQLAWLEQVHPPELAWYRHWNWKRLKPGVWNWLYRAFVEFEQRQWAAFTGNRLQGVLSWAPGYRQDALWLASPSGAEEEAIAGLLLHARRELGAQRRLAVEHPAGRDEAALRAAGFTPARTLVWMRDRGATP